MNKSIFPSLCSLLTVVTSGCAVESSVEPSSTSSSPEATEQWMKEHGRFIETDTTAPKSIGWWQFSAGPNTVVEVPGAGEEDMCMITEVAGRLDGGWLIAPKLVYSESYHDWILSIGTEQKGRVTCVPFAAFIRPSSGVTWWSEQFEVAVYNSGGSENTWWGNSMTYISDVRGDFDGDGEYVRINQSSEPKKSSSLQVANNKFNGPTTRGHARSLFVGVQGTNKLTSLIGYKDGSLKRGNIKTSGTFTFDVSTVSGYSSFWMADTEAALCVLTRVQGQYDSLDDQLVIYKNGSQWYLRARSTSSRGISGSSRCMAYDQR